ncbi:DUF4398 domain-containing protein [Labilithrix luteola]|uniref:DUF4398 domain-containing protein n=1 Tax=Labilithrix luteola TaxID=1391654 RepID=UPI001F0A7251|nr:DUF4398 domain-containing protein [Labilithrix luteola]
MAARAAMQTGALALALGLGLTLSLTGCGSVYYSVSMNAAQSRIEQARAMGAETAAPYEYYYAREHMRQAEVEAADASYGDAASYAETAEQYAQKAIDFILASRKGEAK